MTINALRGRVGPGDAAVESLPIGDADANVQSCPNCSRPLAMGVGRCPGCGTRLLLGVAMRRASVFVVSGIAGGVLVGSLITAIVAASARTAVVVPVAPTAPAASVAPTAGAGTSGSGASTIPTASMTALRQTAILNSRLAVGVAALQAELAVNDLDTVSVARSLRTLAADAEVGLGVAPRIDRWDGARGLGSRLRLFYASVGDIAREGLAASLTNEGAYRTAAIRMIETLAGIAALDADSRAVAAEAGVTIPSALLPAQTAP